MPVFRPRMNARGWESGRMQTLYWRASNRVGYQRLSNVGCLCAEAPSPLPLLQAAKALLRRGASGQAARDQFDASPFDAAVARGRVEDEELFLMLASG